MNPRIRPGALASDLPKELLDVLSLVGHELRGPSMIVLGWARILRERSADDPMLRRAVNALEHAARHQERVIGDLLDFSRLAHHGFSLVAESVDLARVVRDSVAALEPTASAAGVNVVLEGCDDTVAVHGDAIRLGQVVTNLVGNAVEFTDSGEVRVQVRPGDPVELSVSDTGRGIAPEALETVFMPFLQGTIPAARGRRGIGLGLAIVRQVIEAHGGRVEAHSDGPGKGAVFTAYLPASGAPCAAVESEGSRLVDLSDVHVLAVDDDPETRELLEVVLASMGASVDTVSSADAAIHRLQDRLSDVLVSDLGLPGVGGLGLVKRLRGQGITPEHLPAIALTGYAGRDEEAAARQAGFQAHLPKPTSPEDLARVIRKLVSDARTARMQRPQYE